MTPTLEITKNELPTRNSERKTAKWAKDIHRLSRLRFRQEKPDQFLTRGNAASRFSSSRTAHFTKRDHFWFEDVFLWFYPWLSVCIRGWSNWPIQTVITLYKYRTRAHYTKRDTYWFEDVSICFIRDIPCPSVVDLTATTKRHNTLYQYNNGSFYKTRSFSAWSLFNRFIRWHPVSIRGGSSFDSELLDLVNSRFFRIISI